MNLKFCRISETSFNILEMLKINVTWQPQQLVKGEVFYRENRYNLAENTNNSNCYQIS